MAGANRIIIPELPQASERYDAGREDTLRKLIRDGFAGTEEFVGRAIREYGVGNPTPPADGDVLTWDDATKQWSYEQPVIQLLGACTSVVINDTTTYQTLASVTIPSTGYYALTGFLYYYATTADDFKLKLLYNSTGSGVVIYDQSTHYETTTAVGSDFIGTGQQAIATLGMKGMLDATSIAGTPTLEWQIALNTDTATNNAIAYAGSWFTATRMGDT